MTFATEAEARAARRELLREGCNVGPLVFEDREGRQIICEDTEGGEE